MTGWALEVSLLHNFTHLSILFLLSIYTHTHTSLYPHSTLNTRSSSKEVYVHRSSHVMAVALLCCAAPSAATSYYVTSAWVRVGVSDSCDSRSRFHTLLCRTRTEDSSRLSCVFLLPSFLGSLPWENRAQDRENEEGRGVCVWCAVSRSQSTLTTQLTLTNSTLLHSLSTPGLVTSSPSHSHSPTST